MRARDIDEVIEHLDTLLADPAVGETHLGLFPALYRQVTLEVRQGVNDGVFEDNDRMDRLDTIFANRYLEAFAAWRAGRPCSRSWRVAFDYARAGEGIALQHLLLGMNAHINLDLGVASAEVAPGEAIAGLRRDFDTINEVLFSLLDGCQDALDEFSPALATLDEVGGRGDERLAAFSIGKARKSAWATATTLAVLPEPGREPVVGLLDRGVRNLGRLLINPGPAVTPLIARVRATESQDLAAMVARLNRISDAPAATTLTRGRARRGRPEGKR